MFVEKPTKQIKIYKNRNVLENKSLHTIKTNSIDFYNLKESFGDEIWAGLVKGMASSKSTIAENIFNTDTHFETNIERPRYNISNELKRTELDIEFIISTLKFDLRVKDFTETYNHIMVYFQHVNDSISFYKQYYEYLYLTYVTPCDWSLPSEKIDLSDYLQNNVEKVNPNKIELYKGFKSFSKMPKYTKEYFNSRVEYFNQLKQCFTRTDIVTMSEELGAGNIEFIFNNTKELAVGCKSNKILQDALKIMSGEEIERLINNLEYDIVPISATKHGAYTIQSLLSHSTNKSHKKLIAQFFSENSGFLITHEIGNYTFQKLLTFDSDLVFKMFVDNFIEFSNDELGLKVFKRCFEFLREYKPDFEFYIEEFKDEILPENLAILRQIMKMY